MPRQCSLKIVDAAAVWTRKWRFVVLTISMKINHRWIRVRICKQNKQKMEFEKSFFVYIQKRRYCNQPTSTGCFIYSSKFIVEIYRRWDRGDVRGKYRINLRSVFHSFFVLFLTQCLIYIENVGNLAFVFVPYVLIYIRSLFRSLITVRTLESGWLSALVHQMLPQIWLTRIGAVAAWTRNLRIAMDKLMVQRHRIHQDFCKRREISSDLIWWNGKSYNFFVTSVNS